MKKTQETKRFHLRRAALVAGLAFAAGLGGAAAQGQHVTTLKLVVPYPAGGVTDQAARLVAERLSKVLGQTMIVENRPGAGSRLGTMAVAQAPADGSTLLFTNLSYSTLPLVDPTVRLDPQKTLAPVSLAAIYGAALVVKADLPVRDLRELVAYARSRPGKLSYGSSGMGSGAHFVGEYFKSLTGTFIVHVPYRSTVGALTDVAGGQVDMTVDATAKPFVDSGKVKALAIIGSQRDPRMPDVPTAAQAGVRGLDFNAWLGLLAPAATPPATIERLNHAMNTALQDPALRKQFEAMGLLPQAGGPERLAQQLRDDAALYRRMIQDARLKFDIQ